MLAGVPWWPSGLRIWCCRCCGLGHCYSMGSMPDPAAGIAKKKKKKVQVKAQRQWELTNRKKQSKHQYTCDANGWRGYLLRGYMVLTLGKEGGEMIFTLPTLQPISVFLRWVLCTFSTTVEGLCLGVLTWQRPLGNCISKSMKNHLSI